MKHRHLISTSLLCLMAPLTFAAGGDPGAYAPLPAEPVPAETLTGEPMIRTPAADAARENARLRAEVESLKSRVSALETRVRELEAGKPPAPNAPAPKPAPRATPPRVVPKAPRPAPRQPVPPAPSRSLPEGWQEREFNGMTFYIVPLKPGEANATPPATVAPQAVETQPAQR